MHRSQQPVAKGQFVPRMRFRRMNISSHAIVCCMPRNSKLYISLPIESYSHFTPRSLVQRVVAFRRSDLAAPSAGFQMIWSSLLHKFL